MPHVLLSDVNFFGNNYKHLSKEVRTALWTSLAPPYSPWFTYCYAPLDIAMLLQQTNVYSLSPVEIVMVFLPLQTGKHCSDQFSRFDMETVHVAVAESHNCGF